jgi:hypothetical protein
MLHTFNLFCAKGESGEGGESVLLSFPCRDEVNSLCPGGGGRGWLAGQSEFTLSLSRRGLRGRGGGPLEGVGLKTNNIQNRLKNTEYSCSKTHVHKITSVMALGFNDFDGGQIHYLGHWKGWALKISTFLGPNCTRFAGCQIRALKSLDFQGPPFPMALKMDFPPSKSLRPVPCKQQVH